MKKTTRIELAREIIARLREGIGKQPRQMERNPITSHDLPSHGNPEPRPARA